VNSIIGKITITEKQALKLGLEKNNRLSPFLEKCCLRLVANESFEHAEEDIKMTTGMAVSGSSQHRLVQRYEFQEPQGKGAIEALSVDGGNVRLRTPLGQESIWQNYKAVSLHGQVCAAFFHENDPLLAWTNRQPLARVVTCLGDGHDGVWNLITQIGDSFQRREVLDWYHLIENLNKVGGSNKLLRRVEGYLWQGEIDLALAEFKGSQRKVVVNFQKYVQKHRERMPDYGLYQDLGICIGSGSVESKIKQIGARIKITGAQWNAQNVSQILKLRCAYLNKAIA
jgi:hypothetical protein